MTQTASGASAVAYREPVSVQTFGVALPKPKLREACRRDGRYLLRVHDVDSRRASPQRATSASSKL